MIFNYRKVVINLKLFLNYAINEYEIKNEIKTDGAMSVLTFHKLSMKIKINTYDNQTFF